MEQVIQHIFLTHIVLDSTVAGRYARRPLNHAVRELSLKACTHLAVLTERFLSVFQLDFTDKEDLAELRSLI